MGSRLYTRPLDRDIGQGGPPARGSGGVPWKGIHLARRGHAVGVGLKPARSFRANLIFAHLCLLSLALFTGGEARANTPPITQDTTWTKARSPYLITGTLEVQPDATLTLEPGVVLRFSSQASIWVKGRLVARGTSAEPIVFTSTNDPAYGGSGPVASPGFWKEIKVFCEGAPASAELTHCHIKNGGDVSAYEGAHLVVRNSLVEHASAVGIGLYGKEGLVEDSRISHCGAQGILVVHNTSNFGVDNRRATIRRNLFTNNGGPAIHAYTALQGLDCRDNRGTGNAVNGIALQCTILQDLTLVPNPGFPYVVISNRFLESQTSINPGVTLSLAPGTIMKFATGNDAGVLYVRGRLNAVGTPSQRIVFTSIRDDLDGDTNNDGSATHPAPGDWQGIRIGHPSRNGQPAIDAVANLDQCDIRYGGANNIGNLHVATPGSRLMANACDLMFGGYAGVFGGGSALVRVKNSIIQGNLYGARQVGTANLDARHNYWGHPSGPLDASDDRATGGDYNPNGQGDPVTDKVLYRDWFTVPGHGQTAGINPSNGHGSSNVDQIIAGDPLIITVTDPDANVNAGRVDTVTVIIVTDGGDRETLILTETGPNTGIFTGTQNTTWGAPGTGSGVIEVVGGNLITITYQDPHNAQGVPEEIRHTVSVRNGNTAEVSLPGGTIVAGDSLVVTLVDKDLDETPGPKNDSFEMTVPTSGGDSVTVTLEETEIEGVFRGEVPTEFALIPNPTDALLQVKGGDKITLSYTDALDGTGKPNQTVTSVVEIKNGIDGTLSAPGELTSAGGVPVTVTDPDANQDASQRDTISVVIRNTTTGETETLVLEETDVDTGVFTGVLPTQFGESPGASDDGVLTLKGGDGVSVTYVDAIADNGQPNVVRSHTAAVLTGHTANVVVALEPIIAGDPISVRVTDPDLAGHGTLAVTATSPLGDRATIELQEMDTPGTFSGNVSTTWSESADAGDQIVQVLGGQSVTMTYTDAIDDVGRNNVEHVFEVPVRKGNTLDLGTTQVGIIAGMTIQVIAKDVDRAGQPSVEVPVTTTGGDRLKLLLGPGDEPGTFVGEIETTFALEVNTEDTILQVQGGETIELLLIDELDELGRRDQSRTARVTVKTGTDGSLTTPTSIKSNEGLLLVVTDGDANVNDDALDTVTVTVTNVTRGGSETLLLHETEDRSGVFQGVLPTVFGETPVPGNGTLEVKGNDTLRAVYLDALTANGQPGVERIAETTVQVGATLSVDTVPSQIQPGQAIPICITDPDRNQDPNRAETVTVTIRTSAGDQLVWTLAETGTDTGVFCGEIPTEFSEEVDPTDGVLQVKGGDTITITYTDPLDSEGRVDHDVVIVIEVRAGATGILTVSAGTITAGAPITIRVTDADLIDSNPPQVEFETSGGDRYTATLAVTGEPGTFSVTVPTRRSVEVDPSDTVLQVAGGQTITIRYTDALDAIGHRNRVREGLVLVRNGADGNLKATSSIQPGEPITLTVTDEDLNHDPAAIDTISVTVLNPETGQVETVVLTETGVATGVFTGLLPTVFGRNGTILSGGTPETSRMVVQPGVTLRASYEDITADGSLVVREATTSVVGNLVEHTFPAGRSLIGIPAQLFGPGVGDVLRIDGVVRRIAAYDPAKGYELFEPGAENTLSGTLRPTVGYFVQLNESAFNQMREFGLLLPQDQPQRIRLRPGWNLIGSPFIADARWNRDLVKVSIGGIEKSIRQAATEGSVVDYLWGLENGQYRLIADLDMNLPGSSRILRAWNGYWILSAVEAELILPTPSASGASVRSVAGTAADEGGWAFMITAQRGDAKDTCVVGSRGAAGTAAIRISKPPAMPGEGAVSIAVVGDGAGSGPGLAYDVRTASTHPSGTSYRLRVDAAPGDPVTLAWNDLRQVPARVRLLLVNEQTGERRYLRTTSSVQVASESGKPQFFQVIAEPAGQGLRIMGLNSTPSRTGGVAVTYSLSTSAQVEMTVLSLTGKPIRRLPQGGVSTQGLNNTTWDGRDSSGRVVPAGTYLIELTARTDIGEVAKTAVPVVLR